VELGGKTQVLREKNTTNEIMSHRRESQGVEKRAVSVGKNSKKMGVLRLSCKIRKEVNKGTQKKTEG